MLVLFFLFILICILTVFLISFQNTKYKHIICAVTILVMIISSAAFTIDLLSYMKGGLKTTEHITISQKKITEKLSYFTVNDTYWSIGNNFQEYKMITATKSKDMEFKVLPINNLLEQYEFIIYYLPVSKFITKIEVSMMDGDLEVSNYSFFKFGN